MGFILKQTQAAYSLIIIILISSILYASPNLVSSPEIKQSPTPEIWSKTLPEYISIDNQLTDWTPRFPYQVTVNEDIHLTGDDVLIIEDCTYILNGVLLAENSSEVIIRNAELFIKEKRSWSHPGDIIPTGYQVAFKDDSRLTVTNSSIVYMRSPVHFGFYNNSAANIIGSDLSLVQFDGNNDAEITIRDSELWVLGLTDDSTAVIDNSTLTRLYPLELAVDLMTASYPATAVIRDSEVESIILTFNEATIRLTEPLPQRFSSYRMEKTSFDGFNALNIELENTTVSIFSVYAYNSEVLVEDQNLYQLLVTGSLTLHNTTCYGVYIGSGSSTISDSIISYYSPHHNTLQTITRSKIDNIHLHSFTGLCNFDRVQADHIEGHDSNGIITGSLTLLNQTGELWHNHVRLERSYTVTVMENGYALKDVSLSLINPEGLVVWSGKTGLYGDAVFSLTYYNRLLVDHQYINNMTSVSTVEAEYNGVKQSQLVSVGSNTPIVFDFSP